MSGPIGSSQWMYASGAASFYSYSIDQSLRFNDDDSAELSKTFSTAQTNTKKITVSVWVKRGNISNSRSTIIFAKSSGAGRIAFENDNTLLANAFDTGYNGFTSSAVFRDTSAWYHIVYQGDSTESTAANRHKVYVNGVQQTNSVSVGTSENATTNILKNGNTTYIGRDTDDAGYYFDGYLAELNVIDGSIVAHTEFGETKDGVWIPKQYSGSYGTNGFYLTFANSSAIGDDLSGNTNDFTANNLAASDVVPDSPTNNFATLIPMANTSLSEGNLKMTTSRTGNWDGTIGSFGVTSGKWYYEVRMSKTTDSTFRCVAGWQGNQASQTVTYNGKGASGSPYGTLFDNYLVNVFTTSFYKDGGTDGTMTAASSGDVINVAADFDNGKIYFGINGTYYANDGGTDGNPGAGTNESLSGIDLTASEYVPAFHIRSDNSTGGNQMIVNFGQEGTFSGTETAGGNSDANGVGNFFNAVPSGFLALCTSNLPDITIGPGQSSQADDNFNTVLWSGNGSTQSITGVGFQPDFIWAKERSSTSGHTLLDVVRGVNKGLESNTTDAEENYSTTTQTSFDTDGFSVGSNGRINQSSQTYVAWNWKAGGSASSNSDGSIASSVSVNTDAGFSIVSFDTDGNTSGTVGHGLGVQPQLIIGKTRNHDVGWYIQTPLVAANLVGAFDAAAWYNPGYNHYNDTHPTSSVFSVGGYMADHADLTNPSTKIAYCFANVEGYSKIGTYVGGGSNLPFVFTGFAPAFLLINVITTGNAWFIYDNKREGYNEANDTLSPNYSSVEDSTYKLDLLSNGFKIRSSQNAHNQSGQTFLYYAIAEAPFKFANAR